MQSQELASLESRLLDPLPIPVIGQCLQKKAVTALAEDRSPEAVKLLAKAVNRLKEPEIKASILDALGKLRNQNCIDAVCEVWADTRHRDLASLLVKKNWVASTPVELRVITALKVNQPQMITNDGEEIVEPLLNTFKDRDSEIANRASECAVCLTNPNAIDYICQKWVKNRDKFLEQIICKGKYVAQRPIESKVFTALKADKLEVIIKSGKEVVEPLLNALNERDSEIANKAKECIYSLTNTDALDYICNLAIESDNQAAREVAIKAEYAPRDSSQRALFYFLTEQWDKYENLDYEHTLLQKVYELGDEKLRKQIADKARQAGRVEWVGVVAGGRKGQRLGEMTDAEWEITLNVLVNNQQWREIWRLAQKAPAFWNRTLLQNLKQVGWQPLLEEERIVFENLKQLSDKCFGIIMPSTFCQKSLTGHTGSVYEISFSPDGKLLATCSEDKTAILWQIPDGKPIATLTGHTDSVYKSSFSPNGQILATCSQDKTVRLWRIPDGKPIATLTGHAGGVYEISFSPDGKLLATCSSNMPFGKTVRLWQIPDGKPIASLTGYSNRVRKISFSPDGKLLASSSKDKIVRLWQIPDGKPIAILTGHSDSVHVTSFSPDGKLLASSSKDKTVRLWQIPDGKPIASLTGHTGSVYEISFSPDGQLLATCSEDKTAILWQIPDGKPIATLTGHSDIVREISFSPDGKLLATRSFHERFRLWHIPDGKPIATLNDHTKWVSRISFSPDGKLLATCSEDKTARLWQIPDGKPIATLTGHAGGVNEISFSPDGQLLATCSQDKTVRLWSSIVSQLSRLPMKDLSMHNRERVQELSQNSEITEQERNWLEFMQALINWHQRFDVEVEDAPQLVSTGEFDIEIEG